MRQWRSHVQAIRDAEEAKKENGQGRMFLFMSQSAAQAEDPAFIQVCDLLQPVSAPLDAGGNGDNLIGHARCPSGGVLAWCTALIAIATMSEGMRMAMHTQDCTAVSMAMSICTASSPEALAWASGAWREGCDACALQRSFAANTGKG